VLQRFHVALDDEDLLLLQLLLQPFFERRQELSRFLRVGREHTVDDNGITIGDARHRPKAIVGLGKKVRPPNRSRVAAARLETAAVQPVCHRCSTEE
jgi:hypothetical protein